MIALVLILNVSASAPFGGLDPYYPWSTSSIPKTIVEYAEETLDSRLKEHKRFNPNGIAEAPLQAMSQFFVDKLRTSLENNAVDVPLRVKWSQSDLTTMFQEIMRQELQTLTDNRVSGLYQIALSHATKASRLKSGREFTLQDRLDLAEGMARILGSMGSQRTSYKSLATDLGPELAEKFARWDLLPKTDYYDRLWREFFWVKGPIQDGLSVQNIPVSLSAPTLPFQRAVWYMNKKGFSQESLTALLKSEVQRRAPDLTAQIPEETLEAIVADFVEYPDRETSSRYKMNKLIRKSVPPPESNRVIFLREIIRQIHRSLNYQNARYQGKMSLENQILKAPAPSTPMNVPPKNEVVVTPQPEVLLPQASLEQRLLDTFFADRPSMAEVDYEDSDKEVRSVSFDPIDDLTGYAILAVAKAHRESRLHFNSRLVQDHTLSRGTNSVANLFYSALSQDYLIDEVLAGGFHEFLARIKKGMRKDTSLNAGKIELYYKLYVASLSALASRIKDVAEYDQVVSELTQIDRPSEILKAYNLELFDADGEISSFWRSWHLSTATREAHARLDSEGKIIPANLTGIYDSEKIRESLARLTHFSKRLQSDLERVSNPLKELGMENSQIKAFLFETLDWETIEKQNDGRALTSEMKTDIVSNVFSLSGPASSVNQLKKDLSRAKLTDAAIQMIYRQTIVILAFEMNTTNAARSPDLRQLCRSTLAAFGASTPKAQ